MVDPVPSKAGLKVLRDLRNPNWRLRNDYTRRGHYVMQWKSWPDTEQYRPAPAVVQHLLTRAYIAPLLKDGKATDWYALTDAGRALLEMLPNA